MYKRITAILTITLLAFQLNASAKQYVHPKLQSKEKSVLNVIVLPIKVEMSKQGVKGAESMTKEAEELGIQMMTATTDVLKAQGFTVLQSPFAAEAIQRDSGLQNSLTTFQTRYDALSQQLYKKPKDVTKGRFTLGDEVTELKVPGPIDAFVFVHAVGVETTKSKGFLSGGLMGMAFSGRSTNYFISVVDSHSGEILFFADDMARGKPEDLVKALTKTFHKLQH